MTLARLSFDQQIESRSASTAKDSKSVNCMFETKGEDYKEAVKRPGLTDLPLSVPIGTSTPQGLYEWAGALYIVTSNTLYKVTSGYVTTTVGTITGTVADVHWAESADNTYLFFHNGSYGYTIDSGETFAQVLSTSVYAVTVDVGGTGYVSPTVSFSAPPAGVTATGTVQESGGVVTGVTLVLVGSGYVAAPTVTVSGSGTGCVATCVLSGFPDGADEIATGAVYLDGYTIVATKAGQIYNSDTDNPRLWNPINFTSAESDPDAIVGIIKHLNYFCVFGEWGTEVFYDAALTTGSPFLRQDSYKTEIGVPSPQSIVQFQQGVAFVGFSKIRGKQVFVYDGMTPKIISTRYIEKYLNADTANDTEAFAFRIEGHTFYVMTLPTIAITLVYDLDERSWYQWTSAVGTTEGTFRIWEATLFNGKTVGLDKTNGKIYEIDVDTYTDDGETIYWRVVTNNLDSGSMRRKFFKSGQVVGDKVSATMTITHSDDDFTTWSAARTVDLSLPRSILFQLGQARRRAWQFLITSDVAIKLTAFEVNIEGGEMESDPQISPTQPG